MTFASAGDPGPSFVRLSDNENGKTLSCEAIAGICCQRDQAITFKHEISEWGCESTTWLSTSKGEPWRKAKGGEAGAQEESSTNDVPMKSENPCGNLYPH